MIKTEFINWCRIAHSTVKAYWLLDGKPKKRDISELLLLVNSEISEALEYVRTTDLRFAEYHNEINISLLSELDDFEKWQQIEWNPHKDSFFGELAGFCLRCFDVLGALIEDPDKVKGINTKMNYLQLIEMEFDRMKDRNFKFKKIDTDNHIFYEKQSILINLFYLQQIVMMARTNPVMLVYCIFWCLEFAEKHDTDLGSFIFAANLVNKNRKAKLA